MTFEIHLCHVCFIYTSINRITSLVRNSTQMKLLSYIFVSIAFTNFLVLFASFNWLLFSKCGQCKRDILFHRQDNFIQNSRGSDGNVSEITSLKPKKVTIFVAILSHPKRIRRRDAIRATWMSACRDKPEEIISKFFTDGVGLENHTQKALKKEQGKNQDLIFVSVPGGFAFAERLLWIWEWLLPRYNYSYFLRIDDDHFLCVDHLLHEIKLKPRQGLYWGFIHCKPNIVRVDEAWLMLTVDIIEEILEAKRNLTLMCHPYGDQAVAIWVTSSAKNVTYFMDNDRIVHKSAGRDPWYFRKDVCERFLSLHGSYPTTMHRFWLLLKLRKRSKTPLRYNVIDIEPFSKLCSHSPHFNYRGFIPEYQFEPKLCSKNPTWRISEQIHVGREEQGERYSKY